MLSLVSISQYLGVSPGDSAVRVAAAAAHLRPLHAPRLTHPHPHQVSLRGSRAANRTSKNFTVPGKKPSTSVRKDHNQCVVWLEKNLKAACPLISYDQCSLCCKVPLTALRVRLHVT